MEKHFGFYYKEDDLVHHGIANMKWGIRRYQNSDGSLTPEGKMRYRKKKKKDKQKVLRVLRTLNNLHMGALGASAGAGAGGLLGASVAGVPGAIAGASVGGISGAIGVYKTNRKLMDRGLERYYKRKNNNV